MNLNFGVQPPQNLLDSNFFDSVKIDIINVFCTNVIIENTYGTEEVGHLLLLASLANVLREPNADYRRKWDKPQTKQSYVSVPSVVFADTVLYMVRQVWIFCGKSFRYLLYPFGIHNRRQL